MRVYSGETGQLTMDLANLSDLGVVAASLGYLENGVHNLGSPSPGVTRLFAGTQQALGQSANQERLVPNAGMPEYLPPLIRVQNPLHVALIGLALEVTSINPHMHIQGQAAGLMQAFPAHNGAHNGI